jgi:hypothetical protein
MHATHLHPRRALAAALAALALMLAAIALPARLADGDLGLGGHSTASSAKAISGSTAASPGDPLGSPLRQLPASVRWPPPR